MLVEKLHRYRIAVSQGYKVDLGRDHDDWFLTRPLLGAKVPSGGTAAPNCFDICNVPFNRFQFQVLVVMVILASMEVVPLELVNSAESTCESETKHKTSTFER